MPTPRDFITVYPNIKKKFQLVSGEFLEDKVYALINKQLYPSEPLKRGFLDLKSHTGRKKLLSLEDVTIIKTLIPQLPVTHDVLGCVKDGFANCKTAVEYRTTARSLNLWKPCVDCEARKNMFEHEYYLSTLVRLVYVLSSLLQLAFTVNTLDSPLNACHYGKSHYSKETSMYCGAISLTNVFK